MSITVKDVADMVERVDEKLSPLTRYDGFQPYEGIYRLGDLGICDGNPNITRLSSMKMVGRKTLTFWTVTV